MANFDNGASVSPELAHELTTRGALLIDVRREVTRVEKGTVGAAVPVPKPEVDALFAPGGDLAIQAQGRTVVVFCTSEGGSGPVVEQLVGLGYPSVVQVSGGYPAWQDAGLPVVEPTSSPGDPA